jgi:bis(5'-nucleosyl)-tetraphosphatase (symmetrical)
MPTYAIGDVQGCLAPLQRLLHEIHYDPRHDELWFTGDLVNRGPQSLETLRFIQQLPSSTVCVLGNHDLGLLAIDQGYADLHPKDTLQDILQAPDRDALLAWLRQKPLLFQDPQSGYVLVHAGIYPAWDLAKAKALAQEIEQYLQGEQYQDFLKNLYGDYPYAWDEALSGWERARFITSAFTRMRFCTATGALNLQAKGTLTEHPHDIPWFAVSGRKTQQEKILFGHWAALGGKCDVPNVYALDSGCVWGKQLTAFCVQTQEKFSVSCREQ